jgi:hypothetical protein
VILNFSWDGKYLLFHGIVARAIEEWESGRVREWESEKGEVKNLAKSF